MKKLIVMIGLIGLFAACQESPEITDTFDDQIETNSAREIKKYIFHVSWENGWKAPDCNKFGICKPDHCWFCCFENGVQVPCPESNNLIAYNSGEVSIDAETGRGSMNFYLHPSDPKHQQMIENHEVCRVVQNHDLGEYELLAGDYEFNPELGEHGGYVILARLK